MILGKDKTKLSKRHGAVGVEAYRDEGFLPEALFNFLALLGASYDPDREVYTKQELIELFDPKRLACTQQYLTLISSTTLTRTHEDASSRRTCRAHKALCGSERIPD